MSSSSFKPNWLKWPVLRTERGFRAYVVQPNDYAPERHSIIFDAALRRLVMPAPTRIDFLSAMAPVDAPVPFDLLTFPEAFLPVADLLRTFEALANVDYMGCVHVGLRPDVEKQHLFSVVQVRQLVEAIKQIASVHIEDLSQFESWVFSVAASGMYNLGCVFMRDANSNTRVCLHAKILRSKYEVSVLHESNMTEANVLSIITLYPEDRRLFTVTLQPLLCSDALPHDPDRPGGRPFDALAQQADCFHDTPPDHVDVVSLALCTPHKLDGGRRRWHPQFRESFLRCKKDEACARHRYATFFLSNFGNAPGAGPGGLSGAFLGLPFQQDTEVDFMDIASWGREVKSSDERWSFKVPGLDPQELSMAHMVYLSEAQGGASSEALMLGFTLKRLQRDPPGLLRAPGMVDFEMLVGKRDEDSDQLHFSTEQRGML